MKRKTLLITVGIVLVLLAGMFWAGRASAAFSCFGDITPGYWAEEWICWLKDNGISNGYDGVNYGPENNIKRSEMAKMLFKQAEIPPSTGQIVLNIGTSDWYLGGGYNTAFLDKYNYYLLYGIWGTGSAALDATPTIPISLYGRGLKFVNFQLCFDVQETHGSLDSLTLTVYSLDTSGTNPPTTDASINVTGPLYTAGCFVYNPTSPVVLDLHSRIHIRLMTTNTSSGAVIKVTRATLTFEPTTELYVP
jgi:hypothetical protein